MAGISWFVVVLFQYLLRDCQAGSLKKPEQLYRLVAHDLACVPEFRIASIPVSYSVLTCSSACKLHAECDMFAVENMHLQTKPQGGPKMPCEICRSGNTTSTVDKTGWSTYSKWQREVKFFVLDITDQLPQPEEPWNVDCNSPTLTPYRNGIIFAIWDNVETGFRDVDKVKCFNWGHEHVLSDQPSRVLYVHLEDYRECPRDYVLTAISVGNAASRNVDKGKCTPLFPAYTVEYEKCVTVSSEGQGGGTVDKWRPWKVQCPTIGPHVAVSLHRRRRIHTGLKCCVLNGLVSEGNRIA